MPERPDQEFYALLTQELAAAENRLRALTLCQLYDNTDVPGVVTGSKSPKIWDFVYAGNHKVPRGTVLQNQINAVKVQIDLLTDQLGIWADQEQEWRDSLPEPSPPVLVLPGDDIGPV